VEVTSVIVVSGGGPVPPGVAARLPAGAGVAVVAADSGVDTALALGLQVDLVVGDLDSVSAAGLEAAVAAGAEVERFPVDKDATDLALALDAAARLLGGAGPVVVVGGGGGRLDHLLAGALALADPAHAGLRLTAHLGDATVHVVHGGVTAELDAPAGTLLSILPVGGPAGGVTALGVAWPLAGATLAPGTTWGVSNVVTEPPAVVSVATGTALVVLPGGEP
jgi:thiamine pyrophosphokinase